MQASVGPYMFTISTPGSRCRSRRHSAPVSTSPPNISRRSASPGPAASHTLSMNDGTELTWLTRRSAISAQNSAADSVRKSGATTTQAPASSGSRICPIDTSNPTDIAASTRSPGPIGSCPARRANARLAAAAWLTATPFGTPVEPEVYTT